MFGGYKTPEKKRIGHYSKALRDFIAEMHYDEGDDDDYKANFQNKVWENPEEQAKYVQFWNDFMFLDSDTPEDAAAELNAINVLILSQSHMDIAWLWRMYQIVNKAKITLGKAAFHAQNLPYFQFVVSQPIMIEWFQEKYPDVFTEFQQAVAKGRIEVQGGMYVEPDGKLPNGESFCRQRLYGQKYYQENFGKLAEIEWLTDSFGYNNNIPQIIRKSGSGYFFSIKLSGNHLVDSADWPFNHFKWRSPDGSEVICNSGNLGYGGLGKWNRFKNNRKLLKIGAVPECDYLTSQEEIDAKKGEMWPEVLITMGEGDGGHGPQSQEVYQAQFYVETGKAKQWISAIDYFHKYDAIESQLPVWNGAELYYNMHQGTLTTHSLVKRMNRFFEWNLTGLEGLFALAEFKSDSFLDRTCTEGLHENFRKLWKDTLLLQFHDILPGSSCVEVYDDVYDIWIENMEIYNSLKSQVLSRILSDGVYKSKNVEIPSSYPFTFFNSSDFTGRSLIEIPLPKEDLSSTIQNQVFAIQLSNNTIIPAQIYRTNGQDEPLIHQDDSLVFTAEISGWSSLAGVITTQSTSLSQIQLNDTGNVLSVQTPHSKIEFNKENGEIIAYEEAGQQILKGNDLCAFWDWAKTEPAWNLGMGYKELPRDPEEYEYSPLEVVENGPVFVLLKRVLVLKQDEDYVEEHGEGHDSVIEQYIRIFSDLPGIYFDLRIDWHHTETILKHYFHFNTNSKFAIAESPYSSEIYLTDLTKRSKMDKQRFEVAGHCWTVFPSTDDSWGVAYINDGKYGFDVENSKLGISVIRGPEYPDPRDKTYANVERQARDPETIPSHIDQGKSIMNYAIIPYQGSWHVSTIPKLSHFFNQKPKVEFNTQKEVHCGIHIDKPNLELAIMKLPEVLGRRKELVFRIVETGRIKTSGQIEFDPSLNIREIELVDILERDSSEDRKYFQAVPLNVEKENDLIVACTTEWNPHEIHTFRVRI